MNFFIIPLLFFSLSAFSQDPEENFYFDEFQERSPAVEDIFDEADTQQRQEYDPEEEEATPSEMSPEQSPSQASRHPLNYKSR